MSATESEKSEHLRKIVNKAHSGFFITHTAGGQMHGRPMVTAQVEGDFDRLWFACQRSSPKIAEIKRDDRVMVGYTTGDTEWAAVNGRARVVDDRAKAKELWSPYWKTWLDGPDDPELILIEVTPESAEYWDLGGKVAAAIKFAVGTITGKDTTAGDNQKLKL